MKNGVLREIGLKNDSFVIKKTYPVDMDFQNITDIAFGGNPSHMAVVCDNGLKIVKFNWIGKKMNFKRSFSGKYQTATWIKNQLIVNQRDELGRFRSCHTKELLNISCKFFRTDVV